VEAGFFDAEDECGSSESDGGLFLGEDGGS